VGQPARRPDTSRVTTVEDFHRKRFLYQLTPEGHATEQAIAFYEEAIGRRGALQSVALEDITEQLKALSVLAADDQPVRPRRIAGCCRWQSGSPRSRTTRRRSCPPYAGRSTFSDGNVDAFVAYKERLIDYVKRLITDLANSGAQIATLIAELERIGHDRLLAIAARREASDAVPDEADANAAYAKAEATALSSWQNRWRPARLVHLR
jgi:uncharacterized protein (TIGR02677 family)